MSMHDQDRRDKRSEILDKLRAHFGEDRTGELADMDGLGLVATFLRRIPSGGEGGDFSDELDDGLSREGLRLIRRRRDKSAADAAGEQDRNAVAAAVGQQEQAGAAEAMTFSALIEEIPRMRENFAEWISGVDANYLPSSSSPEELQLLHSKAEYRLKVLKVMSNETQKELEALTLALKGGESAGGD
jgi:hypothetical protein